MPITALPIPPSRSDPTNFPARGDAFLSALPTFATEANALQLDVNNKQTLAAQSQAAALDSENKASASASSAVSVANTVLWVSGVTYNVGTVQYSPTDFKSYRRKSTGSGTVDPAFDLTNYVLISQGQKGYMQVRDQKASGTPGGAATATGQVVRTLNTVVSNSITGASLSANTVTLTPGNYYISASAPLATANAPSTKLSIFDSTNSVDLLVGASSQTSGMYSTCTGVISLTANTNIRLRSYVGAINAAGNNDFGTPSNTGQVEVYAGMEIWRLN